MHNEKMKADMLALFRSMHSELEKLLSNLSETQKNERGSLQQWAIKDMLVHLAFWGSHFKRQVTCTLSGEKPPMAGDYYDLLNDGLFLRNMDTPYAEAFAQEEKAHEECLHLLETLDADDLCSTEKYAWLEGRSLLERALGTEAWHVMAHISDFYLKQGNVDQAVRLQETYAHMLRVFPVWDVNAVYNLACFYAQNGMAEKAIENLQQAFQQRPDLAKWALKDTDLDPLREHSDFTVLLKNYSA